MSTKLTPPSPDELEPIPAAPPVAPVEPAKAPDMLPDIDPATALDLRARAETWVGHLAKLTPQTPEFVDQVRAIQRVAVAEIRGSAGASSSFLDKSLQQSRGGGGHAAEVSRSLVDLRNKIDELAPSKGGLVDRIVGALPGMRPLQRYFRQYESNQEQLNNILLALDRGQDQLRKDNASLGVERKALWEAMAELKKVSGLLEELDQAVVRKLEELQNSGDAQGALAMEQDVLFAVRQRHVDVQTQLAVSVQSYLSMDLIQDNNLKLIDGVERAKTTTMTALRTAVIVAQALENQKLVLDQIDAVNQTTNSMIEQTSAMLRQNTARIQEQAATSGISIDTLQRAYDNVFATIDQVEQFRATANQNFAKTIDTLSQQLERSVPYLERARDNELARERNESIEARDLPPELTL